MENKKIIGLTPAKGISKGVPRKNIRELYAISGFPATIEKAKKSDKIHRITVSTKDEEIDLNYRGILVVGTWTKNKD